MSTAHPTTYVCEHCGGPRTPDDPGSYCSEACHYRYKGEKLQNQLHSISQTCNTCYGHVRDVQPIPDELNQDADGLQYPTPRTTISIDDFSREPHEHVLGTRWSCECGAVNPDETTAELQNIHLKTVIVNFYKALEYLYERGAISQPPSRERYFTALREEWRDAAYAAGRAVYG